MITILSFKTCFMVFVMPELRLDTVSKDLNETLFWLLPKSHSNPMSNKKREWHRTILLRTLAFVLYLVI